MHDLFGCWERSAGVDLSAFTDNWLTTAGPDALTVDRDAGVLRRTPPAAAPADRTHTLQVATAGADGTWRTTPLTVDAAEVPFDAGDDDRAGRPRPGHLGAGAARRGQHRGLPPAVPHDHRRDDPCLDVERGPLRLPQRAGRPGDRPRRRRDGGAERDQRRRRRLHPPVAGREGRHPHPRPRRRPRPPPRRGHRAARRDARRLHDPAGGLPGGDQLRRRRTASSRAGWPGRTCPTASTSTSTCAGGSWSSSRRWARWTPPRSRSTSTPSPPAAPGSSTPGRWPRCPTRTPRPGPGSASPARSPAPNYELQAAGLAMWRTGQEHLTAPYVERYFAELPAAPRVHSGWVLGDVDRGVLPDHLADAGDAGRGRAGHRRRRAGPDHPPEPGRPDRRAAPPAGDPEAFGPPDRRGSARLSVPPPTV